MSFGLNTYKKSDQLFIYTRSVYIADVIIHLHLHYILFQGKAAP